MDNATRAKDDRELVERIVAGDREAFQAFVEKHQPNVFRLARGILGDWHLSEDVCQEVFILVYRKLGAFRRDARVSTWLYRIAVNAALRARKRWRSSPRGLSALSFPGGEPAVEEPSPSFEGEEVLKKLLAPLPMKLRTAVALREHAGLGYEEIAQVLGCSRGAVEQRIHRAMRILREVWKKERWR